MLPSYPLLLASAGSDSTALTNTVTPASILYGSGVATLPAGVLQVGSFLECTLRGRISTLATTPGTLTLDLRIGGVVVSALGALALNINAQVNASWEAQIFAAIKSVGAGTAATALVMCRFTSRALLGSVAVASGGDSVIMLPDTTPAVGTGFDSTLASAVQVFGTWSTASVSNSIQTHQSFTELKV